jgi:hypothetical protein
MSTKHEHKAQSNDKKTGLRAEQSSRQLLVMYVFVLDSGLTERDQKLCSSGKKSRKQYTLDKGIRGIYVDELAYQIILIQCENNILLDETQRGEGFA